MFYFLKNFKISREMSTISLAEKARKYELLLRNKRQEYMCNSLLFLNFYFISNSISHSYVFGRGIGRFR